jgi:hypothetical protein
VPDRVAARAAAGPGDRCVHCHADVGHGETVGLGGPWRSEETKEIFHE